MSWGLRYTEAARRDLRALDHAGAQRILKRLDAIRTDPLRSMKRLKGTRDWRLRVGDWRVVAPADPTDRLLIVKRIQHRSVVYDGA